MRPPRRRTFYNLTVTHLEDRSVPSGSSGDIDFLGHLFGCLCQGCVGRVDPTPAISIVAENNFLTAPQSGDLRQLALDALQEFLPQTGLLLSDVSNPVISSAYSEGRLSHVYLHQRFNGLEVLNANLGVHFTSQGELISIVGGFVPGLSRQEANPPAMLNPTISAAHAAAIAAHQFGYTVTTMPEVIVPATGWAQTTVLQSKELSAVPIQAQLAYVYTEDRGTRLAWQMELQTADGVNWYHAGVDAEDGTVGFYTNYVSHIGTYNVFAQPIEHPGDGQRTIEVNPAFSVASPFGWHDTNGVAGPEFFDTRGNNVFAQDDLDANNSGGARPSGGTNLIFDFPFNPALQPNSNIDAATAQLFYMNNMMHDISYMYGFTEAAGNFQQKNYTGLGKGGDPVQADVLDGSGTNNANFGTPPDGSAPRMQMFRWTFTNPSRDSDFDNGIIAHEYGHGITNRLTGGPANSSALGSLQSGGMGEGWSDFFALMLSQVPSDVVNGRFPIGTYVLGQHPVNGAGIRQAPYSFDMSINPMTFNDFGTGAGQNTQVHWAGSLWNSALWDLNWLLINKYGFDSDWSTGYDPSNGPGKAGNKLTMQLVMDGLKLQPANPSFIQARDAILAADLALTGGMNRREIWTAFARRGLGFGASTANASSSSVTTSFAMPPSLGNPGIIAQTPTGVVNTPQNSLTLTFSEPMDTNSFSVAQDVQSFTGPGGADLRTAITGFNWVNGTTLRINFNSQTVEGNYSLVLGPDIRDAAGNQLDQNIDGTAGNANDTYRADWRYDAQPLQVLSITPANGGIAAAGLTNIDVIFNVDVDPASVNAANLQLSQGSVTGASLLTSNSVRYTIDGLPETLEVPIYLNLKHGALTDLAGFPSAKFISMFTTDIGTAGFPTPLTSSGTGGWMGYEGSISASIAPSTDVDSFTIALDAGQGVTLVAMPDSSLRPVIELYDPSNTLVGSATASAAGQPAYFTGFTTSAPGVYSIRVSSAAGSSGAYTARLMLNAAVELERDNGPTNNTRATAQPMPAGGVIGGAQISSIVARGDNAEVGGGESEPNNDRANANSLGQSLSPVAGSTRYILGLSGNIQSGGDQDWFNIGPMQSGDLLTITETGSRSGSGTLSDPYVELWRLNGGTPQMVAFNDDANGLESQLIFTISAADTYFIKGRAFGSNTGTYMLGVQLTNTGTAPLSGGNVFQDIEPNGDFLTAQDASTSWRQEIYRATVTGTTSTTDPDFFAIPLNVGDRVAFEMVGTGFTPAFSLQDSDGTLITEFTGISGTRAFIPSYYVQTTGLYYVNARAGSGSGSYTFNVFLNSTVAPPEPTDDYYSFTATAGEQLTVAAKLLNPSGTTSFQIQDGTGTVLASSSASGASNYDLHVPNFTAPADGTYFVRIVTTSSPDYQLALIRGGSFEREANDSFATAQPMPTTGKIGGFVDSSNSDWFSFNVPAAGLAITVQSSLPGDGPGEFDNTLDPRVELYQPDGSLLAVDDNSAADGKNARIRILAPVPGTYVARILANGSTSGPYGLLTIASPNNPPANLAMVAPPQISEGDSLSLSGSATDADDDVLNYSWDLNDDGVFGDAFGANPNLSWAQLEALGISSGPADLRLAVRVTDGLSDPVLLENVLVTLNNTNPTASGFTNSGPVNEGSTATVTLSSPTDVSSADLQAGLGFAYDFDNDGIFEIGGDGTYANSSKSSQVTVPAMYLDNGPFDRVVRVRVIDQDDGFTEYLTTITVNNVVPTATLGNGGSVVEGSSGNVNFSAQGDASPADTTAGFKYAFDFGNDGVWDLGDGTTYANAVSTASVVVPSSFLADGPRSVAIRARIFDQNNGFSEYTTAINVTNSLPTATLSNAGLVLENQPTQVLFSGQADLSPVDVATGFKYAYDFNNDGVWDLGTGLNYAGAVSNANPTVPASFITEGPGTITVRARIFDKDSGFTTTTTVITIQNADPTATISTGGSVLEGAAGQVSLANQFDSPGDFAAGLRYAFDLDNDGVFEIGSDGSYALGVSTSSAMVPANLFPDGPGSLTVRGRIIDRDGGFTDYTTTIDVLNAPPTATLASAGSVPENTDGQVSFSNPSDPSSSDTAAGFRYAFDFDNDGIFELGDGSYAGSLTSPTAIIPAAYLPNGPANAKVRGRILDQNGGFTDYLATIEIANTPPTATLGGTAQTTEGGKASIIFGNQSDASPLDLVTGFKYAYDFNNDGIWDFGTGTYASGVSATTVDLPASFLTDGPVSRTVRARILDQDEGYQDYTFTIQVNGVAPTAKVSNSGPVSEGGVATILLSDRKDISPEDQVAGFRFAFDFDNDGTFEVGNGTFAGSSVVPAATVPAKYLTNGPGVQQVRVRIIDKDGDFADLMTGIQVNNLPPTAAVLAPPPGAVGEPITVSIVGATDPSPEDVAAGLLYSFDFNNNGSYTDAGDVLNAKSPMASLTFTTPGTYVVGAKVADRDGAYNEYTTTVVVRNVPPTGTLTNSGDVLEGGSATVSFQNVNHPSGIARAAGFRYAYDFNNDGLFEIGDGTFAGSVSAATATVPAELLANGPVTRAIRARVIEVNGLFTDYTTTLRVSNVAPTATFEGPTGTVFMNTPFPVRFSNPQDPSSFDRSRLTYRVELSGPGTVQTDPATGIPVSVTLTQPGPQTIRGIVRDASGAETSTTITVVAQTQNWYAVGPDAGHQPIVRLFDGEGKEQLSLAVFGDWITSGVRVATGDFNGDGIPDLVAGTGPGFMGQVRILDGKTGRELLNTIAFEEAFTGGVFVAVGDLNGDQRPDLVISPDQGGGPRIRIFDGTSFKNIADFFGIDDTEFRGGARATLGDLNGDGVQDLLVSAGFGGGPRIAGFDGRSLMMGQPVRLFADFFAYEDSLRNGAYVSAGDIDGDGKAELITGGGPGGGPRVQIFAGRDLLQNRLEATANFFAGDTNNRGGVRTAVKDLDGDGIAEVIAGAGTNGGSQVTVYTTTMSPGGTLRISTQFDAYDDFDGGVFVG